MFWSPSSIVSGQTSTEMKDEVETTTMDTDWKSGITWANLSVLDSEGGIEDKAAVDFLILDEDVRKKIKLIS